MDQEDLTCLLSSEIVADSASELSLNVAKKWLDECIENHKYCSTLHKQIKILPTRVIDVGSSTANPRLCLKGSVPGRWTALSYTWGGASSFILNQKSLTRLENGLPLEEFPATIRDAIIATRALGIEYLWVDSLCIFQDSPEDWSHEAPKMDDVYNHAEVVIAATVSLNVNSGLFKIRSQIHSCHLPWKTPQEPDDDCTQQYVGVQPYFDYFRDHLDIENYQWATRGWTMQEDLLASRLLSYTRGQIGWECPSALITESGGDDRSTRNRPSARQGASSRFKRIATHVLAGDVSKSKLEDTTNLYSIWYGLLHYYSRRNLTVASDRLAALAGFASRMQIVLRDEYCAGLWKGDLIRGLLWNHGRHHGAGYPSVDDKGGLRGENIGPSWSWASLEGELDSWPHEVVSVAEVIDIHADALDGNNFSRVNGGRLVIAAPFIGWDYSETTHPLERFVTALVTKPDSSFGAEYGLRHKSYIGQRFAAIHIASDNSWRLRLYFLLLETVQVSDNGEESTNGLGASITSMHQYRRVCMFFIDEGDDIFKRCKWRELPVKNFVIV